jgi:hypothetical protein
MMEKLVQRTIVAFFAVLILSSAITTVEAANMSVSNVGPTFVKINIIDIGDRIEIVLDILDMNGWEDIRTVYVNATDSHNNTVESALFKQDARYGKSQLTYTDYNFSNVIGNSLLPGESIAETSNPRNIQGPDSLKATREKITFVFKPFSAYYIHISAFDKKGEKCEESGPFSSEYHEPPIIENPVVPLGASLIAASAAGVGIYVHRKHSNKLAQLAEEKMGGA